MEIAGSFALNAGIAGAESVLGVDASQLAIDQAEENARLNGLEGRVDFLCADVFELLPELEKRGRNLMWLFWTRLHLPNHGIP